MDIAKQFEIQMRRSGWFDPKQKVLVAVSTGVDSMVLLTLMQQLPADFKPRLIVAHVNHQLRQQSQVEEAFITDYCQRHQLQLEKIRWPVSVHPQNGVEAAARRFRYTFFGQTMQRYHANALLTAHHADDQAETVLMKLVRGGQLSQLQGILPEQPFEGGRLLRPLLAFNKQQIRDYALEQQLKWYEDETNQADNVLRNRIRHQVIPVLKRENPAFLDHVREYTAQLTANLQLADERTAELLQQVRLDDQTYSVAKWRSLSAVSQRAVLRAAFQGAQLAVTAAYLDEVTQLLNNAAKPTGILNLTGGKTFEKAYDRFSIKSGLKVPQNHKPVDKIVVISNQWVPLSRGLQARLVPVPTIETENLLHMSLDLQPAELPISIRRARPSDEVKLINGGHKSVRRILIDHKVPRSQRSQQLVAVTAKGEVLWLIGLQRSARDFTEPNYELVLKQSD